MSFTIAQQIFMLILGSAVTGAFGMWCLMRRALNYARWAKYHSNAWRKEQREKQEKHVLWIKHWSNDMMNSVPLKLRTEDRQVLVKYKDLLNVWDKCDHIWFDLSD